MLPSGIRPGTATSTDFLHSWRTATRLSSIPNAWATVRSRWRAIASGFSRRWLSNGGATALTTVPLTLPHERYSYLYCYRRGIGFLLRRGEGRRGRRGRGEDREADRLDGRGRPVERPRDDLDRVAPRLEVGSGGAASRDPEAVAAREHGRQRGEGAEALSLLVPEVEREPRRRDDRRHRPRPLG